MASLKQKIESLLFVAGKPLGYKDIAKFCRVLVPQVKDSIDEIVQEYKEKECGMFLISKGNEVQMVTHPDTRIVTEPFLKEEIEGNLSRAALETLAIIMYRQPITRPEIDIIRGVNSSIMLRNLLMRGLIDRQKSKEDARMFEYSASFDLLKFLGVAKVEDLPDFVALNQSEAVRTIEKSIIEAKKAVEKEKEEAEAVKEKTPNEN